jgi:hypothetical protein
MKSDKNQSLFVEYVNFILGSLGTIEGPMRIRDYCLGILLVGDGGR